MGSSKRTRGRWIAAAAGGVALAFVASHAEASEGGASVYLLGSGGPGAAIVPPIEGVFLADTQYHYSGEAGGQREFVIGGNVVAGLEATVNANFATLLWVPTTDLAGGTLAVGLALPVGGPDVDVSATLTGPGGRQIERSKSDSAFVMGDPLLTAIWGWKSGKTHIAASTLINVPIGQYRKDKLANLAFHRWAADVSLAGTYLNEEAGWDVSGKAGFTFNGENDYTSYETGTEFHAEAAVEKKFNKTWSAGVQGYYFEQVSGDSGAGARLGSFKGRVAGLGVTGAYNFMLFGKAPATLRLHAIKEFEARNRLEGESIFLDFSMPLWVNMPPGAGS
ncbi:transporter [Phenylobacterium sp. LjRoot164]|uniref:SphA family protein n=1 Tax=unclassified Phenylobacterium TaxID=2640670 RepID=UPI003ED043A2